MNRKEIERLLAEEFLQIIGEKNAKMRWTGSTVHLIELVKYVYENNELTDDNGILLSRNALARRILMRMHVRIPKNLSVYFQRSCSMKGVRNLSLLDMSVARQRKGSAIVRVTQYVECEVANSKSNSKSNR